jgi:hypothetical protein
MEHIKKRLVLEERQYYQTHLNLINCILPVKMTAREVEILAAFMALKGDIAQFRFGPSAKKIIMEELELSPAGLSNFIGSKGSLIEKGFLVKQGDLTNIIPLLMPEEKEQLYTFKLEKKQD